MGNVADEAMQIRELLEEYLPQLAGGGAVEVTAEQIVTAMAGALAALGLRAPATGQASGLFVAGLAGDNLPAVAVDALSTLQYGVYIVANDAALYASSTNAYGIEARSTNSTSILASQNNQQPAIRAINSGQGAGIQVEVNGTQALNLFTGGTDTTPTSIINITKTNGDIAVGTGLMSTWTLNGFQAGAAATDSVVVTNSTPTGGSTKRTIAIRRSGNIRTVAELDSGQSATQTALLLEADGAIRRVKLGAAGTGPGGAGRMLFMD